MTEIRPLFIPLIWRSGQKSLVAEDAKSDFAGAMIHPTEKNLQAVAFYYDKLQWKIIDPSIAEDMEYLADLESGEMRVVSRTLDDKILDRGLHCG